MKLAKTIRFDASDLHIFDKTADEGEWAIAGSFMFGHLDKEDLTGKTKQAFANGFVGVPSFGFSTLVSISNAQPDAQALLITQLARMFVEQFSAPSEAVARQAAIEEVEFMAEICAEHEVGSLLAIQRELTEQGIKERFSNIPKADSCAEQKLWTIIEDETDYQMETPK